MRPDHFAGYVAAWLIAALVPTVIGWFLFDGHTGGVQFTFFIALAHALLLGLPFFKSFSARGRVNLANCVGMGAIIGAAPTGFLSLLSAFGTTSASRGGIATIVNGVPTLAGVLDLIGIIASASAIGAAAGLGFWLTLRASGAYGPDCRPAVRDFVFEPPLTLGRRPGIILAAGTALAVLFVMALPTITKDRSCHNLFRDGRTSAAPALVLDLQVDDGELSAVAAALEGLAQSHGMSVRWGSRWNAQAPAYDISFCREPGLVVKLQDRRWVSANLPTFPAPTSISLFTTDASIAWQPAARDIATQLEQRGVRFKVSRGNIPAAP